MINNRSVLIAVGFDDKKMASISLVSNNDDISSSLPDRFYVNSVRI